MPIGGHVVLCGMDGIGGRIAEQLYRAGETVVVLEQFASADLPTLAREWGLHTVAPAGTIADTLAAAGLDRARAIVCVTGDDLTNLQIALLARQDHPELRVVAQLGNTAIREALTADGRPGAVLDVATLSAPAIVDACLRRQVHPLPIEQQDFRVAVLPVDRPGTLRARFGDLAPVAVIRGGTGEVLAGPGRDLEVAADDWAAVLGTPDEFAAAGHPPEALVEAPAPPPAHPRWRRTTAAVTGVLADFDRGLFRALATLIALVGVSTVVLWRGYRLPGMSALDALYFSTETVATVGYGDFNFVDQDPWLRMWAIFLMLAGITTTAMLMAFLADMLISRRLNHGIGRRRARGATGHMVVVGLGSFGIKVAASLVAAGQRVVIIERDPDNRFLADAAALDLPVIFGDATLRSTLEAARVPDAAAVAILTGNDMVNIETALAVRNLLGPAWGQGPTLPVVVRVFDRNLGRTVAQRFGFRHVQSTEEVATVWFVGAALGLDVLGSFPVADRTFMVGRLRIDPGTGLIGLAMHELSRNARVIAIDRGGAGRLEHPPRRGTRFGPGDLAYVVGPYEELIGLLRSARAW